MKKYALWVKILTFVLCVVLFLSVAVSGLGVILAGSTGMYHHNSYDEWLNDQYYSVAANIAQQVLNGYGASLSEVPKWLLEQAGYAYAYPFETVSGRFALNGNEWYYMIKDSNGNVVVGSQSANVTEPFVFEFENMSTSFLEIIDREGQGTIPEEENVPSATMTEATVTPSYTVPATTAMDYAYAETYWDPNTGEAVYVESHPIEGHHITVGISKNYTGYRNYIGLPPSVQEWLFTVRMYLIGAMIISFALFAAAFVFLMVIAGKNPKTGKADPKALNKLPLDLYLAAAVTITIVGYIAIYELMDVLVDRNPFVLALMLICGCGVSVATVDMGFFTALAAQFKMPRYYWFQNSICGRILMFVWKYCKILWRHLGKYFYRIVGYIRDVFRMLPVIWKWIAAGGALGFALVLICATTTAHWYSVFPLFVWCLVFAALVTYCGYSYGMIQKGIKRLQSGNLNEKINAEWLFGSFKTIAEDLNALADVVQLAAEKQLKAERMKTELITNVSHDIKTPLTSVINYVDLLQQPHTEEEGENYLEVLSRQSQRLKKLVEDLMDMSKASSGNMEVNIEKVDAVETVNQALGEFADKLDAARLTPVFRIPDSQLHMLADGRLTWRVLSNLLSNVVKYALPGTRVYVDLTREERWVICSIKNISREELNISAEELTERFARGDASRNTEGSGLGLNIAQSLMQLQKGSLELTVDGDLFKVTLVFPAE